jgi:hypothetical protein
LALAGSGTIGPALAAAPAGAALRGRKVLEREFVAVAAARPRQDVAPDAFPAEKGEY